MASLVADTYDLILCEIEVQPQHGLPEDHPPLVYAVATGGFLGLTGNPDEARLREFVGQAVVVFRGAGKCPHCGEASVPDKNGLPQMLVREDRFEIEPPAPAPPKVRKRNRRRS